MVFWNDVGQVLDHSNSVLFTSVESVFPAWSAVDTVTYPFTQFRYPAIACLIYFIIYRAFSPAEGEYAPVATKSSSKKILKLFTLLHNLALMVFSMACFAVTVPAAWQRVQQGFHYTFCESGFKEAELWTLQSDAFGCWVWLFYLSKIYEFIDTWIVMLKGRRPITLQVYHHIGAVFCMWFALVTRCNQLWIFVCFNSFVHSWMYAYYAYASLGFRFPYKKVITKMQIVQLLTGNCINTFAVIKYYWIGGCPKYTNFEALAGTATLVYVSVLLVLFQRFFQSKYTRKTKGAASKRVDSTLPEGIGSKKIK